MRIAPLAVFALLLASPAAGGAPPRFVPDANLERARVPDAFKWNLAPLFPSDAAFEEGLRRLAEERRALVAFQGKLGDPATLKACLDRYFAARLLANKLTLYARLRFMTDQRVSAAGAMNDRALAGMAALMADASFLRQEVLRLDDAAMARAFAGEPGLSGGGYRAYLEELRRRRGRLLGPEAESVLSLLGDNLWAEIDLNELPSDLEKSHSAALADLALPTVRDEKGKPVRLTLSSYPRFRSSPDRRVRREAVEGLLAALRRQRHLFAATYAGQVNLDVAYARARGYRTALEAYLDKDDIDPAVYRNLVSTVRANLAPLHRYVELRKRVLRLPEVRLHDLYVPLVREAARPIPFDQARRVIPLALAPLGDEVQAVLRTALDPSQGWIDLYPNAGKESGASSSSVFGVHPFIQMNYLDDMDGLSTLAHELGHAVHSHLSMARQPYPVASYSPFVAEVASTCNEMLLADHLVAAARTRAEKLAVLGEIVESIRTTIYRQAMFADFELAAHQAAEAGTPLTAEWLGAAYLERVKAWYGPSFTVGADDEMEWAYVPHFYYKYYVYSYATGLSAGIALSDRIRSEGAPARDAYLGMLSGGSSKPPLDLLKGAGVDLSKPAAIEAAARALDRALDEMERLLPPGR